MPEPGLLPPLGVSPLSPARACPRRPRPACHRRCAVAAGSSHVQALCQLASMIGIPKQKQLVGVLETQPGRCRSGPVAAARGGAATRGGGSLSTRGDRGSTCAAHCCMLLILGKLLKGSSHPQRPTWAAWGQAAARAGGLCTGAGWCWRELRPGSPGHAASPNHQNKRGSAESDLVQTEPGDGCAWGPASTIWAPAKASLGLFTASRLVPLWSRRHNG